MKSLLTALLLLIGLFMLIGTVRATNYYFSSSSGNDNYTSAQAQNPATPWKTLDKLNSFFNSLRPGDSLLFKRGDVFYGSIIANRSGSASSAIAFSAYGSGEKPVITGFTTVNAWANLGGNIWESINAVSALPNVSIVTVGGVNTAMGRYPNSGYLTINSHTTNTSITSSSLPSSPNWDGGEVVIRKERWILDRNLIINHSGTTINYISASIYNAQNGLGFFIQGHPGTLDSQNEWYYNPYTKKIRIYSTVNPANVQISTVDNLVSSFYKNYLTFDNLSFSGANNSAFYIGSCISVTIQNCDIGFCNNGVFGKNFGGSSANFKLQNSTINHINNNAVGLTNEFKNAYIGHNIIQNTGMIAGMGGSGDGMYQAINSSGANSVIEYNNITSTGYISIGFAGNFVTVNNNYIDSFCSVKDDGGGIYCGNDEIGKMISNNIVLNGIGAGAGTNAPSVSSAFGIYIDGNSSSGVSILNNSIRSGGRAGIFLHNPHNLTATGNTIYNHPISFLIVNDQLSATISGLSLKNNILFAKTSTEVCADYTSLHNDINNFGIIDNNYYARPINDNKVFYVKPTGSGQNSYSLAGWKTYSGLDANSKKSPKTITTVNDLRFEYNATSSTKVINLGANYIDVDSVIYPGTITLAPYTSAVLIYLSKIVTNQAPVANAGIDQSFFLPIIATALTGSGTDADGTIASYEWTKISGPDQFTIVSPAQAQTEINNLVQGAYQFELKVTDDLGAVGRDTMVIIISPVSNQPPDADAGPDQNITLPTNTVILSGNGIDSDGTIASYQWTNISGPAQFTIVSPFQAQTEINNLVQGVYQFELKVTDDLGTIRSDTVVITVNPVIPDQPSNLNANQPPTANAGLDINMTLPTNTIQLIGSGADPNGTIASYYWSKISGPDQSIIVSPFQPQTIINNMVEGVYQFELKVTDDLGTIGSDTVVITVNPIIPDQSSDLNTNQPPIANAGLDINMTLPTNTATLIGSGDDIDGNIASYLWSKISGPRPCIIRSPAMAQAVISNLVQGIYQFELKVTDSLGAVGKDTVVVIVNPDNTEQFFIANSASAPELNTATLTNTAVYPNPATDVVNIKIDAASFGNLVNTKTNTLNGLMTNISIYNSGGILVFQEKISINQQTMIKRISIRNYPAGMYFIKIGSELKYKNQFKFIKQ